MSFNYGAPGVYIEEVPSGARPIESAATSVLGIVGLCADTIRVKDSTSGKERTLTPPKTPTLVTSLSDFESKYGNSEQAVPGGYLYHAMKGFFDNGGRQAYVVGVLVPVNIEWEALVNIGGKRQLRLSTTKAFAEKVDISVKVEQSEKEKPVLTSDPPEPQSPEPQDETSNASKTQPKKSKPKQPAQKKQNSPNESEESQESKEQESFTLVISPRGSEDKSIPIPSGTLEEVQQQVEAKLKEEKLDLTVTISEDDKADLSVAASQTALALTSTSWSKGKDFEDELNGKASERTGIAGLEAFDDVTIIACPDIVALYAASLVTEDNVKAVQSAMFEHCEKMKNRFAILDAPKGKGVQEMEKWRKETMNFNSNYAALYYPWVKVGDQLVPPSGHIAGVYARVDSERGVHKAPANEVVRGVIGLERNVSRNEQGMLNPSPINVNCIRSFPGRGIRIWGARTLSSDAQWRYINVRRLFCNIEDSILQSTSWVVFEPNDELLWSAIRRDIRAYLTTMWRSGALFGRTPEQAFYVRCDEETNPQHVRDLGYCIIEVGIAPVKPAEFVVFRISQKDDGSGSASE